MASIKIPTNLVALVLLLTLSFISNANAETVTIKNDCKTPLRVKCTWKRENLGNRVLDPVTTFEFIFVPPPSEATVWYCNISFENGSGVYDIYNSVRDIGRCKSCLWSVRPDGLHGISEPSSKPEVFFKWQSTM